MSKWSELSIEYANQRSYLDDLFQVYPTKLIKSLLLLEKFPFKDSYVNFLRLDSTSFDKNPQTINRLAGMVYSTGIKNLFTKSSEPKETNTQMGGKFSNWLNKGVLGVFPIAEKEFLSTATNAILKGGDKKLTEFAKKEFGYNKRKGLDFIGRFNGKYVIGGNQGTAFTDIETTITAEVTNVISIGILDGIPWLKDKSPYYKKIISKYKDNNIMSALVLREFLYQL